MIILSETVVSFFNGLVFDEAVLSWLAVEGSSKPCAEEGAPGPTLAALGPGATGAFLTSPAETTVLIPRDTGRGAPGRNENIGA